MLTFERVKQALPRRLVAWWTKPGNIEMAKRLLRREKIRDRAGNITGRRSRNA
jgi:hypothetical protein